MVPLHFQYAELVHPILADASQSCPLGGNIDGACYHLCRCSHGLPRSNSRNCNWRAYVDMLCGLFDKIDTPCCLKALNSFVFALAKIISAAVPHLSLSQDLRLAKPLATMSGKRRRGDEDYRRSLAASNVEDLPENSRKMIRSSGFALGRSGIEWDLKTVQERIAASGQLLCCGVVAVCEDASNHGKPAESVQITLIWCAVSNLATVSVPVVSLACHDQQRPILVSVINDCFATLK